MDAAKTSLLRDLLDEAAGQARLRNHSAAAELYRRCLVHDSGCADAWKGLGDEAKRLGDVAQAMAAYRAAVDLRSAPRGVHFALADLMRRQGQASEALAVCEAGLRDDATVGEGHVVRSAIRKDLGDVDGAITDLRLVIEHNPGVAAVHVLLGDMQQEFGRLDEAIDTLTNAVASIPDDAHVFERLVRLLAVRKRPAENLKTWETIVTSRPRDAEARRSLAVMYQENGRNRDAFDTYQKALEIDPRFARAYTNLGSLILSEFRFDLAQSIFEAVVRLAPDRMTSYHNLGVVLRLQGQLEAAAENFRQALIIAPNYFESLVELCHIRQHFCDWDGLDAMQETLFDASYRKGKPIPPFAVITSERSTRADQQTCARTWGCSLLKADEPPLASYEPRPSGRRRSRLRVGYASTDLHTHATAMLLVELLEKHDKSLFELYAYSFGPEDGSPLRRRLIDAFDVFADCRGVANAEAIRQIHADDLDILIDLKGYTQDARTEILAARPAPIQVNYLGYPGTMGAPFIDYLIADAIVVPPEHADAYDEKIVHLPNCYQPNDRKRPVHSIVPTREACGLPSEGFVFCCFNNSYKINATTFAVWMRLLVATPGSVLWLLEANRVVAHNLRRAAAAAGVPEDRIVFAPRLPASEHLARLQIADLFLDTMPVNAHTTASEALWVGLPVLTCLGDTFISRVAGSLLHGVGLPELVTTSLPDYEAAALRLARDGDELRRLRAKLRSNRDTAPLFDTERYARHFEAALLRMDALRRSGQPPEAFAIGDDA